MYIMVLAKIHEYKLTLVNVKGLSEWYTSTYQKTYHSNYGMQQNIEHSLDLDLCSTQSM